MPSNDTRQVFDESFPVPAADRGLLKLLQVDIGRMVGAVGDNASRFRLHFDRSGDVADFELDCVKVHLLQRADRDAVLDVGLESRLRYFEIVIRWEDIGEGKRDSRPTSRTA